MTNINLPVVNYLTFTNLLIPSREPDRSGHYHSQCTVISTVIIIIIIINFPKKGNTKG